MAKTPLFLGTGIQKIGASEDGHLAYIWLIEKNGSQVIIAFPPDASPKLANDFLAVTRIAETQADPMRTIPEPHTAQIGPLVTNQKVQVSDDASALAVPLTPSSTPFLFQVSKSRSAKLRDSLEQGERDLEERQRKMAH